MIEIHSKAYREQYGDNFICVIPTNIYGENDNYHLEDAHVIPALIHKCKIAKESGKDFIVKGSGKPLRQFIYSEDLAKLIMWILENYDKEDNLILSPTEEYSIEQVAREIAKNFDYEHRIQFDTTGADGQFKKTVSNQKLLEQIGTKFEFTSLQDGIQKSVKWFINHYETCRK
jgi:GDP-L-fucose synthase